MWLEGHIKLLHLSVHFFALLCFDLTGQRRHFNEELWRSRSFLFSSMDCRRVYREGANSGLLQIQREGFGLAKSSQMATQGSIPSFQDIFQQFTKRGSSLGEHLVSGLYLMTNSSFSQQRFVDIVSVRVTFPLLLMGQVCCIAQGFWLSI